jgi:predicted MFS family arabinose efflux permease
MRPRASVAAPNYGWFVAAWVLAGVAMRAVFYAPAFAALTRFSGTDTIRALTALTLVAGFASTAFAPLTAALSAQMNWRHSYLVLAVVMAVIPSRRTSSGGAGHLGLAPCACPDAV